MDQPPTDVCHSTPYFSSLCAQTSGIRTVRRRLLILYQISITWFDAVILRVGGGNYWLFNITLFQLTGKKPRILLQLLNEEMAELSPMANKPNYPASTGLMVQVRRSSVA